MAGFSAALAAARHGAGVCLIQNRPVLGGNSSSEIRVTPHGAAAFHGYARESGILAEALIEERAVNHEPIVENGWTNSVWDMVLYDMAVRTENLTLHLNTSVTDVEKDDGRQIAAVTARVENAETELRIEGDFFIDCTGDGTVAHLAGAEWRSGTESRDAYDEPHAPSEAGPGVMGSSLHFKTVDVGKPAPFHAPEWAVHYDDPDFFYKGGRVPKRLSSGYWWIEIGPPWDTLHDNEQIRHELTRHTLGIWDYLKNRDPNLREQATNLALDWIGQVPGKRENRRVMGELLLTENDLLDRTVFDDEVAFGGWYVDMHTLGGLLAETSEPLNARGLDPTSNYGAGTNVGPFGLPLRIMISQDVENLLLAGRNVSATHAAMSSIRVMSTCAVLGQAAGTAASTALRRGVPVARVADEYVGEVQQTLLRDGCFLPNQHNTDPEDLARKAVATVSSQDLLRGVGPNSANWLGELGQWHDHPVYPFTGRLERRVAQWISLGPARRVDTLQLCLSNEDDVPQQVDAELHAVSDLWEYRTDPGTPPLAETTLTVPPGGPHWVTWPIDLTVDQLPAEGGYIRVDAAANPRVEWHEAGALQPGNIAAYEAMPGRYRRFAGGSTLSFRIEPAQDAYAPANVLSGVTRPHRRTNLWRSDPVEPLPQWLELAWEQPRTVQHVQLTFAGHLLREYHAYPPFYRDPQCVRDYALEAWVDGEWHEVARVEGNYTTRVVHDFDTPVTTDRLRLVVYATNGDPSAGVYEVRCYETPRCARPSFTATSARARRG